MLCGRESLLRNRTRAPSAICIVLGDTPDAVIVIVFAFVPDDPLPEGAPGELPHETAKTRLAMPATRAAVR